MFSPYAYAKAVPLLDDWLEGRLTCPDFCEAFRVYLQMFGSV